LRRLSAPIAAFLTAGLLAVGFAAPASGEESFKWLCKPGKADNPCLVPDRVTTIDSTGKAERMPGLGGLAPRKPEVDCFYVYPTISSQVGPNAELVREPGVDHFVSEQVGRFGRSCRIFAPLYRSYTVSAIFSGQLTPEVIGKAYAGVKAAWRDYLKRYNKGRGVILIGHSQGTGHLGNLIAETIDRKAKLRKRLVSALLIGGNIYVPKGKRVGGQFRNVPACSKRGQTGCAIAYSGFLSEPPGNALFGRVTGALAEPGLDPAEYEVMCVNPANLAGGSGKLVPFRRTAEVDGRTTDPFGSSWVTYPDMYRARCERSDGAHWLQVDPIGDTSDPRPRITESLGRTWGTHLTELNDAAGNLVAAVDAQTRAYAKKLRNARKKARRKAH